MSFLHQICTHFNASQKYLRKVKKKKFMKQILPVPGTFARRGIRPTRQLNSDPIKLQTRSCRLKLDFCNLIPKRKYNFE